MIITYIFFCYIALIPRRGPTSVSTTYLTPNPNFFALKAEWFTRRGLASSPHKEGKCPHRDCVNRFLSPQCEQHTYADERVNRKGDAVSQAAFRGSGLPAESATGLHYFIRCMQKRKAWLLHCVLRLHHTCTLNQPSWGRFLSISAAFTADFSSLSNSVLSGSCIGRRGSPLDKRPRPFSPNVPTLPKHFAFTGWPRSTEKWFGFSWAVDH